MVVPKIAWLGCCFCYYAFIMAESCKACKSKYVAKKNCMLSFFKKD